MTTVATRSRTDVSAGRRGRLGHLAVNVAIHAAMVAALLLVHTRLNGFARFEVFLHSGPGDVPLEMAVMQDFLVLLIAGALGLVLLAAVLGVLRLRAAYGRSHTVTPLGDLSVGVGVQIVLLVPFLVAVVIGMNRLASPHALVELWPGLLIGGLVVLVLLPVLLGGLRRWASWEHRRAALLLGHPRPAAAAPLQGGPRSRLRQLVRDPVTWGGVRWLPAYGTAGLACSTVGVAIVLVGLDGVRGLVYWQNINVVPYTLDLVGRSTDALRLHEHKIAWMLFCVAEILGAAAAIGFFGPRLALLQARLSVLLLGLPSVDQRVAELSERVGVLSETRAGAVDAHAAELRRIERDLHDGTQAQLVNVTMRLGMAERSLPDGSAEVARLIRQARSGAEEAMIDLRGVLRTMYPPVLADRGLDGALLGLAGRCTVATTVETSGLDGLPAPVEAAAYFVVAEALTNVAKHSSASHAEVTVRRVGDALSVGVTDDGLGGVDETRGTGIVGMRRRAAALDGWLEVTSPAGGPTAVIAELPCGS